MSYQEFKIPGGEQGRYFDSIDDAPNISLNENQFISGDSHNYLDALNKSIEYRDRLIERQNLIKTHQLLENVRQEAVADKIRQARRKKIGSFIDSIVYGSFKSENSNTQESAILNQYLELESDLGGQIFEYHPDLNHSFHYHDRNEWFWLCTTKDENIRQLTRYVIDENNGIFRSVNDGPFEEVSNQERSNLINAVDKYRATVLSKVYNRSDIA